MPEDVKPGTVGSPFGGSKPIEANDTGDELAELNEGLDVDDDEEEKPKSGKSNSDDESGDEDGEESEDSEDELTDDLAEDENDEESEEEDGKDTDEELSDDEKSVLESDSLYKELKKANPEIFKKHPELKGVIFREREYSTLFPTVKEAELAAKRSETFARFEDDIFSGNTENLLKVVERSDEDALAKLIDGFLPTVEKLKGGKDLYFEAVAPAFKRFFAVAFQQGDENIKNAAGWLHKFMFNNLDIEKPYKEQPKVDPEREKFQKEKEQFETQKYVEFHKETSSTAVNILSKSVAKRFEGTDFSPFMVNKLTDEIMGRIGQSLAQDRRHISNMDSLWSAARSQGYGNAFKNRIIQTYLSRAKALVPTVTAKVLSEAKGGKFKPSKGKNNKDVKRLVPNNKGNAAGGRQQAKPDWSKVSEREFLDS